jgi:hypothetical protein
MPLVDVKRINGKYRLVEKGTSKIARTQATGAARDGGGHRGKATASRQASYVNQALKKKGYK